MYILSPHDEEKVKQAECTNDVFNTLTKYWSLVDYANLESITQNEIACDNVRKEMKVYGDEVRKFCERRVSEVPPDVLKSSNSHEGMEKLVVTLDLNDPSLKYVKHLKEKIANILSLNTSDLLLYDIGKGSILITFLVMGKSTTSVKVPLTAEQVAAFKKEHIVALKFR